MIKINLKDLMDKESISINKLSNETGLSRPTLTSLMNNDSKGVQFDTLETLLDYFNVPITDLLLVTDREIKFYFNENIASDDLLSAEKTAFGRGTDSEDGLVELKPSEGFPFDCQIIDTNEEYKPFFIMVSPVLNEEKILALNIGIFRHDENYENVRLSDVNRFLSRLNNEAIVNLTDSIVSNWLKSYIRLKPFKPFFESMLMVEILIYGFKTRVPVVIDIDCSHDIPKLSYSTFMQNSKIKGDDIYSSKITFIHGKP